MNKPIQRRLMVVTLAIALAGPLLVEWRARVQGREWNNVLQEQAARLAVLSAENQRLSKLIAGGDCSLSSEEFRELLRLRGEMRALREKANGAARLRAASDRPVETNANVLPESARTMPEPETIQAHWSKEQLHETGYATPLNALQTTLWAFMQNDPKLLAASVDPQTRSNLIAGAFMEGGTAEERLAWQATAISDSINPASGFYVGQEIPGPNAQLHVIPVYFENEKITRLFVLSGSDQEWKVQTINGLVGTKQELTMGIADFRLGTQLWP